MGSQPHAGPLYLTGNPSFPFFNFTMQFFQVSLATLFFAAFASAESPDLEKRDPGFIVVDFEVIKETQTAFFD